MEGWGAVVIERHLSVEVKNWAPIYFWFEILLTYSRAVDSVSNPGVLLVIDCLSPFLSSFLDPQIPLKSKHKKKFALFLLIYFCQFLRVNVLADNITKQRQICISMIMILH